VTPPLAWFVRQPVDRQSRSPRPPGEGEGVTPPPPAVFPPLRPDHTPWNRNPALSLPTPGFEANEMQQREAWISPERNDMTTFELPCCERKIKVQDNWPDTVHCFFCGFPHERTS